MLQLPAALDILVAIAALAEAVPAVGVRAVVLVRVVAMLRFLTMWLSVSGCGCGWQRRGQGSNRFTPSNIKDAAFSFHGFRDLPPESY